MATRILVLGGGITGQLVQHLVPSAVVADWKHTPEGSPKLTRSFGANYLWEPIPGIECREFEVVTHVDGQPATAESVRAYKTKVGKAYELDEMEDPVLDEQFRPIMRGYDFVKLPEARIQYGFRAERVDPINRTVTWMGKDGARSHYDILISTIPLYSFINLMQGYELFQRLTRMAGNCGGFQFAPIYVSTVRRPIDAPMPVDVLYVNYLSSPNVAAYRYCDRFGERHFEGLNTMGTVPNTKLVPGKIHDLDGEMYTMIHHTLWEHGIRCFGRYARWESDQLVHHTYHDIVEWKKAVL